MEGKKNKNTKINIDFNNINIRRALVGFMVVVIVGLSFVGYKINEVRTRALDVYIGSEKLGTIRNEEDVQVIVEDLKQELSNTYKANIVLDKEITYEPTHAKDQFISSNDELSKSIKSRMSYLVSGYSLVIDGVDIGSMKTEKELEDVIEKIKELYLDSEEENSKVKEVSIVEDVKIVNKEVPFSSIKSSEDLINHIKDGGESVKVHVVEAGESFWTIAKIYNISVDELTEANLDKNPTKLKPGDEVKLLMPKSLLTVATVEEVEYTENTNFEVKVELNENMYANEKKTKVAGVRGTTKITANEIKHNGIVVEKEVLKEEVIKEPIDQVVVKGTKAVPKTVATGAFLMPTRGRISSRYGMRNGRMHRGLDIAAPVGTAIKAADGGTVTFAGYKNSYGYMVEVSHGNGYVTRYAHCSKLLVKRGDKVYKGQHIANVGNTGRSTGPHLHLEVLKNGVHQNPANFVR